MVQGIHRDPGGAAPSGLMKTSKPVILLVLVLVIVLENLRQKSRTRTRTTTRTNRNKRLLVRFLNL
jgi:hypothetical protein